MERQCWVSMCVCACERAHISVHTHTRSHVDVVLMRAAHAWFWSCQCAILNSSVGSFSIWFIQHVNEWMGEPIEWENAKFARCIVVDEFYLSNVPWKASENKRVDHSLLRKGKGVEVHIAVKWKTNRPPFLFFFFGFFFYSIFQNFNFHLHHQIRWIKKNIIIHGGVSAFIS